MEAKNYDQQISVTFSNDEAIVFFEWLHNFNDKVHSDLFTDQSEERILFDLEAELEKNISIIFQNEYKELLLKARQKIRDSAE